MIIHSIKITDFKSIYGTQEFNFDETKGLIKLSGPIGAGKKSLVFRFSQNAFKREEVPTFQIDFMFKMINKDGKKYNVKVFRPKDENEKGSKEYLKATKIVMYVFDVSNEENVKEFKENISKAFENAEKNALKYVIGNKIDLNDKRVIKSEEAKEIVEKLGLQYREVSALSGDNVNDVFNEALDEFIKKFPLKEK